MKNLTLIGVGVDDAALELVAAHMPLMERLDVEVNSDDVGNTDASYSALGLAQIVRKCEQLQDIDIGTYGPVLSEAEWNTWSPLRPGLSIYPDR